MNVRRGGWAGQAGERDVPGDVLVAESRVTVADPLPAVVFGGTSLDGFQIGLEGRGGGLAARRQVNQRSAGAAEAVAEDRSTSESLTHMGVLPVNSSQ